MNGRKIEIVAPLNQAFELTKQILFRPFDLIKWLVIGFAAFLAHLGGGGFRVNFPTNWSGGRWHSQTWSSSHYHYGYHHHLPGWVWPLLIIGIPLGIAIVLALAWIGARGRFIFVDCVVRNRAAIVAPWHEFAREANSLFLFSLLVALAIIIIAVVGILPIVLPAILHRSIGNVTLTVGLVFWIAMIVVIALAWAIISQLIVPIMYRQRCRAWDALQAAIRLVSDHAASFILYVLFIIALSLAIMIVIVALTCATCCVAGCLFALPYLGTVLLLPVEVTLLGYTLFFLRQFGDPFDVWAGLTTITSTAVATPPPSVQTPISPPPPGPPPGQSPYEPPPSPPRA